MFDLRTLEKDLRDGKISKKEVDAYLKSLPDEKANTEEIAVTVEERSPRTSVTSEEEPTFSSITEIG